MAVTDALGEAIGYARERPAVAGIVAAVMGGGGALYWWRSRKQSGVSGTASLIYGPVGDASKFPPDGYPGVIVSQPGAPAPTPAPLPTPGGQTKPPGKVTGGKPGEKLNQGDKPYYCPSGSFLTWEKGGTGNHVCQRSDGTQFPVKYRR